MCFFFPTENGELYTFGESEGGKLGLGDDTDESNVPQHVMSITDRVKAVSCGGSHTVALTGNEIHPNTWQVTHCCTDESNIPQHVMSITDRVKAVSCGGSHTVALTGNEIHPNTSCPSQTE